MYYVDDVNSRGKRYHLNEFTESKFHLPPKKITGSIINYHGHLSNHADANVPNMSHNLTEVSQWVFLDANPAAI